MIWSATNFQDAASPIIIGLIKFHDFTLIPIIFIITYVTLVIAYLWYHSYRADIGPESHDLEVIWTFLPIYVLVFLAIPSLRLLYIIEEPHLPAITLKATGHQWYWSYDYADFIDLEFDSYILPTNELNLRDIRLLETDNRIVLPFNFATNVLVTRADVLHSWTIPRIGIKADAIPGRLNLLSIFPKTRGIFYGQCSEICGANHSFIPISLETVRTEDFIKWANNSE